MNLPYTMTTSQAASAVAEFAPAYVYPYHYQGFGSEGVRGQARRGGLEDEGRLRSLVQLTGGHERGPGRRLQAAEPPIARM